MPMRNEGSDPEKLEVPDFTELHSSLLVNNDQKPVIGPVEANTDLLARLESFLPRFQKSNEDIHWSGEQSTCDEKYILELPEQHDGKCIELDLACGIFDLKNDTAIEAAEKSVSGVQAPVTSASGPLSEDKLEIGKDGQTLSRHPGIQEL